MLPLLFLATILSDLQRADARLATIAWRLQTANAAICGRTAPLPGFSIQTLDQFVVTERAEATATFGLRDLPQIIAVVPGGAGARAGLREGDSIDQIDGRTTARSVGGKASYTATAATEAMLARALATPPARLMVGSREVMLTGDAACPSQVQLVPGARLDASADAHYVQISGPMYEFAREDRDLAFVVAHELAHNLFPDAARVAGDGARQRVAELAADRWAIWMMARAGFRIDGVALFLDRLNSQRSFSWLDGTHPRSKPRIAAAQAVIAKVKAVEDSGGDIAP